MNVIVFIGPGSGETVGQLGKDPDKGGYPARVPSSPALTGVPGSHAFVGWVKGDLSYPGYRNQATGDLVAVFIHGCVGHVQVPRGAGDAVDIAGQLAVGVVVPEGVLLAVVVEPPAAAGGEGDRGKAALPRQGAEHGGDLIAQLRAHPPTASAKTAACKSARAAPTPTPSPTRCLADLQAAVFALAVGGQGGAVPRGGDGLGVIVVAHRAGVSPQASCRTGGFQRDLAAAGAVGVELGLLVFADGAEEKSTGVSPDAGDAGEPCARRAGGELRL